MTDILMPKATAVWLVDNSSLTFEQIADFCGLHPLEVNGIADGEVARDIRGADPIGNGQLTRDELEKAEKNPVYRLVAQKSRHAELLKPAKKTGRYTPVSRRQDRPVHSQSPGGDRWPDRHTFGHHQGHDRIGSLAQPLELAKHQARRSRDPGACRSARS
jgi:hypothetical protein